MGKVPHLVVASLALLVTIQHQEDRPLYHVVWHSVDIGTYTYHPQGARRWRCCQCSLALREEASIIRHIYQQHCHASCCAQGVGASCGERILYTGEVRTNERRARMPWRLSSPEVDL